MSFNFTNKEQLKEFQDKKLKETVNHVYNGSDFYKSRFKNFGVAPDDIKGIEDLSKLPFTTADDLKEQYPFPLLSVLLSDVVRIHSSSGTTGKRKIFAYTRQDIEDWKEMFARCYRMAGVGKGSRVQIMVGYGLWTAGVGFQAGCEGAGALAIPTGPGNLDMQRQFLIDLQPDVICCTSSMALLLAEEINRMGLRDKINIQTVIQGSERCSDAMRLNIIAQIGAKHLHDITGLTELYGPGAGIDCEYHTGIHYWSDYYILEIINPETGLHVKEGEIGEMVVTTLRKQAAPLIRYRTRDLTRLVSGECQCGSIYPRHDRILGRSDDMIKYRGVNIYPGQIDEILSQIQGISSEYAIYLDRQDAKDFMKIKVERNGDDLSYNDKNISNNIKSIIKHKVFVSADIEIVDYGSLNRSERKTKRIFDMRD